MHWSRELARIAKMPPAMVAAPAASVLPVHQVVSAFQTSMVA
jgi:hypothetical protein